MASFIISGSLGASEIKFLNLNYGQLRFAFSLQQHGTRSWIVHRPKQFAGLMASTCSTKAVTACSASSDTESATKVGNGLIEAKSSVLTSNLIPNSSEVESLLTDICDTTSIVEFELELSGFRLYVSRDMSNKVRAHTLPSTPVSELEVEVPDTNGSVSTSSLALHKPAPSPTGVQTLLDKATDEGLMILKSPKVGIFRRSRAKKGKQGPPICKENQIVKEGQVLCYIEQLSGLIPIESDTSGEVIRILKRDGDPVGYGDALIAILPAFPGIKKLQ